MSIPYTVIIPARYASTRLPGKLLERIGDIPLIRHVYESAAHSGASRVVIATDDQRIHDTAIAFGADVVMTGSTHRSGTDRLAEAIGLLKLPAEAIVVNLQGDEYGMPAELIDQVARALHENPGHDVATLCKRITHAEELRDPNLVKVVMTRDRTALYFSRAPIHWTGDGGLDPACPHWGHIGMYAYRAGFVREFTALPACALEGCERLEQLRALYYGYRIHVQEAAAPCGIGIDTPADLERVRAGTGA